MKKLTWLSTIVCSLTTVLAANAEPVEQSIFNGKDLSGWSGDPQIWSVQDGAILGKTVPERPLKANTFLVWTNGVVGDFDLTCKYRLIPSGANTFGNSGIQYRSKVLDNSTWVVGGYQADLEAGPNYTGILYEEKMTRGIMALRGEKVEWTAECQKKLTSSLGERAELQKFIRSRDWNEYRIVAKGNRLQHFVNGKQTIEVTDNCSSKAATNGVLALQMHVGTPFTVEFKDIKLRRLE